MKATGKRQKGGRLERKFAQMIRETGLDDKASRMPLSGASWALPTDIHTTLPFSFECKNQERMNFWDWWEQAKSQERPMRPAVLVHSSNFRPIMVSLEAKVFLDLLKEMEEWKQKANG